MDPGDAHIYSSGEKKGLKRKLTESSPACPSGSEDNSSQVLLEVRAHVDALKANLAWVEVERSAARRAAHSIAELAKQEEYVDLIVEAGAIEALVPHMSAPGPTRPHNGPGPVACEHEVEKDATFTLGLLAVKPEHQRLIADAGALPPLVSLLKRRPPDTAHTGPGPHRLLVVPGQAPSPAARLVNGLVRRAADAITNLAHENGQIKSRVRTEGGIPPLVELLESPDPKVQRAAAGALRTLAFKNESNKNLIVECNALHTLILMLRSEDTAIHYEAVGVIGNLVHSSSNIKKVVLQEGALQPVIGLLSSRCPESQREAALLLGQFATTDPECKVRIVQRGAVRPLIVMLEAADLQLREMAAFALGRLAQVGNPMNSDNQAGIVHDGGLGPLLSLLDSKNGNLQHNAAFALYGLADNQDNVAEIVQQGGVQRLIEGDYQLQASEDCKQKTLKRLEEKMCEKQVLRHLLYLLRVSEKATQRHTAVAMAHLCAETDQRHIFVNNGALEVLLEMVAPALASPTISTPRGGEACISPGMGPTAPRGVAAQTEAARALYKLAERANALNPLDNAPPPPTPQVYLGEKYVNCSTLSDVTFLVEGQRVFAHRIALLASSDAFRAMFDGGYREKEATDIEIPNIDLPSFECMMRCIYTGTVEVKPEMAQDLLRAADQYLLEQLKRLCEECISKSLCSENVAEVFDLAETYHAGSLRQTCVLFVLGKHKDMCSIPGYNLLLLRMVDEMRVYFMRVLRPRPEAPAPQTPAGS